MSEDKSRLDLDLGMGCLPWAVGLTGLVATFALGPIDLTRSVYSQIIGDTPVLKRELVDYVRKDIKAENSNFSTSEVEIALSYELRYREPLKDGKVDPSEVSIIRLWDAAEDHSKSFFGYWFWPSVKAD